MSKGRVAVIVLATMGTVAAAAVVSGAAWWVFVVARDAYEDTFECSDDDVG